MSRLNASWKDYFSPVILARGYDYYVFDHVLDIEETDTGYTATVDGSEAYTVDIDIEDGELIDADCSCPYAEDCRYCKHEAAVLYYIENMVNEDSREKENSDSGLRNLIQKMREENVRNLLFSIAKNDSSVRKIIYYEYDENVSDQLIKDIGKHADKYLAFLNNERNYYNEYRLSSVLNEFENFIESEIRGLLEKKKCYYKVYYLSSEILDGIPFPELYDLGWDCIGDIETALESLMVDSYNLADMETKSLIENSVRSKINKGSVYREFLIHTVKDKKLAKEQLTHIMGEMEGLEEWARPYDEMISLMEVLEYPEQNIIAYMKENIDSYRIQRLLSSRLYRNGRWKECITLLLEIKTKFGLDDTNRGLLKRIYREHNLNEELKQFLLDEVKNRGQMDLSNIKELRGLLSEMDWSQLCSELKSSVSIERIKPAFLEYIEDWTSLMDYVEEHTGWYSSYKYCEKLEAFFPERVVSMYEHNADAIGRSMQNRSSYAEYAHWLKRMGITSEGKKKAIRKVEDMRIKYPRHRALHDELRKVGL